MSSFKKKTVTNSTSTTTPNVPDWLAQPYKDSAATVSGLAGQGPSAFTPTIDPGLSKTWTDASNLTAPDYTAATNAMGPEADFSGSKGLLDGVNYDLKGTSAADFMDRYRGMFSKDIIDPVLADYDQQAGQVRAAQAADGARNGAFRGGRFGLREGQTEGELARGRAATYGGLLKDAENFALSGATGDAGRLQSAQEGNRNARFTGASTLSGITNAEAANRNTRAGLLSDITSRAGSDARSTLDLKNRFGAQATDLQNQIKQYPLEFQKQIQGLLSGLNPALFTGQTTTGSGTSTTSGLSLGEILKAAATAAAMAGSDRRIKKDVEYLCTVQGYPLYAFRYIGDHVRRIGVMAQDVLKIKPEAVHEHPLGFLMVDYGAL